ncbi:MAG: hypothetical protein HC800_17965 [Phormidesmis sp. RL_2_1]|nr:hypothetical protein [Phormidesmis sp. RL_2_1]
MSMSNRLLQKGFQPISLLLLLSAYGCLFLFLLWAAYTNRLPLDLLSTIPNYDKLGHLILYCIPSYLGHRLCRQKQVKRVGVSLPVFPGLFALFTIVEELIQGLSPYRTLDAGDMICSLVGIWVGCWLAQRRDSK